MRLHEIIIFSIAITLAMGMSADAYSSWIPRNISYQSFEKLVSDSYSYEDTINVAKILNAYPGYSSRLIYSSIDSLFYFYREGRIAKAKYHLDRAAINAGLINNKDVRNALLGEISVIANADRKRMNEFVALIERADSVWSMICSTSADIEAEIKELDTISESLENLGLIHIELNVTADAIKARQWSGDYDEALNLLIQSMNSAKGIGYSDEFVSFVERYIDISSSMGNDSKVDSVFGDSQKYLSAQKLYSGEGWLALSMAKVRSEKCSAYIDKADSLFRITQDSFGLFNVMSYRLQLLLKAENFLDTNLMNTAVGYIQTLDSLRVVALPNHVSLGEYYRSKAAYHRKSGSLSRAESYLILSSIEFRSAEEMLEQADVLLELARLEREMRKDEDFFRYLLISEGIYRYFGVKKGLIRAFCERALEECDLKRLEKSKKWLSRADSLNKSVRDEHSSYIMDLARARILEASGEKKKALEKRLSMRHAATSRAESIENELSIAGLYYELGNYSDAASVLEALATELSLHEGDRAWVRYNLIKGKIMMKRGEFKKAVEHLRKAFEGNGSRDLIADEASAGYYLSNAYDSLGEIDLAIDTGRRTIELLEVERANIQAESVKYSFLDRSRKIYRSQIARLLRSSSSREYMLEACYNLSYLKGRVISEMLGQGSRRSFFERLVSDSLLDVRDRIKGRIEALQKEASSAMIDEARSIELTKRINEALEEYDKVNTQINLLPFSNVSATKYKKPLPIFYVRKNLIPDSTAVLQYFLDAPKSWVFVLTPDTLDVFRLKASKGEIRRLVKELVYPLHHVDNYAEVEFDVDAARKLREILIDSVSSLLSKLNINQLIIQADASLNLLPFELLVTGGDVTKVSSKIYHEYRNLRFLVDDYSISYIPSIELLYNKSSGGGSFGLSSGGSFESSGGGGSFESSGGGSFESSGDRPSIESGIGKAALEASSVSSRARVDSSLLCIGSPVSVNGGVQLASDRENFEELRFAVKELKEIARRFNGKIVIGGDATESAFKHYAPLYQFIHVATHARFYDTNPNLSYLKFSTPDNGEDGRLQMGEIASMKINAKLLFLNACDTGEGKLLEDEGLIGIARAFLYAGCKNMIVNQWRVYDRTSDLLAEYFYSNLADDGIVPAKALQESKKALRKEHETINGVEIYYYNPVFWAPSIMVGSGR